MQSLELLCYGNRMQILSVFLVPAAFIYYYAGSRDSDAASSALSYASGIAAGLCALLVASLVTLIIPEGTPVVFLKFIDLFLTESLIPYAGGLAVLWYVFDSPRAARLARVRPQLFGIATVCLPSLTLFSYNLNDLWAVLFIPAMLLSALFVADYSVGRRASAGGIPDGLDLVETLAPALACLALADLCKTFWYFHWSFWIYGILSLLLIAFSFMLRLRKYRR